MKTILVPTDFSATSCNAARYAIDMARSIGSDLVLAHILPDAVPGSDTAADGAAAEAQMELLKIYLQHYCNDKVCVTTRIVQGTFLAQIDELAKACEPFTIIMGTRGAGTADKIFLGSCTLGVAWQLHWPLLVIPADAHFTSIDKIGLACEMKNINETIPLKGLSSLFSCFKASFEALYVIKQDEPMTDQARSASRLLQYKLDNLDPGISMLTSGDIATGVSDFVHDRDIDLLLTLPKRDGFLESIFQRNPAGSLIPRSDIPVMVLHV